MYPCRRLGGSGSARHRGFILCLSVVIGGCAVTDPLKPDDAVLVAPGANASSVSDGAHGGNPHFFFLPPLTADPETSGVFDAGLSPRVSVCALGVEDCDEVTWFGEGDEAAGPVTVSTEDEHYSALWHTNDFELSGVYRITAEVDGFELGFLDVEVVANGSQLKNVDSDEFFALKDGRTLVIHFRVEDGALPPPVATVTLAPSSVALEVGESAQLTAGAFAANGDPLSGREATWSTADPTVASVDASGLVQALAEGMTTVSVTIEGITETVPVEVAIAGVRWQHLSTGLGGACGLTTDGTAYCWGSNLLGSLGIGTAGSGAGSNVPVPVLGNLQFAHISSGNHFTCGVASGNQMYCWGSNNFGQVGVGDGSTGFFTTPQLVGAGALVDAGAVHACSVATDGSASCWGSRQAGQVGDGTTGFRRTSPVAVVGGLSFQVVEASGNHTCGITDAGAAYCWGSNSVGQLGNGSNAGSAVPVPVSGSHTWLDLEVSVASSSLSGGNHSCGVTTGGLAFCWGHNSSGQLGTGDSSNRNQPTQVQGLSNLTQIAVGASHVCALDSSGAVWCWGNNTFGQMGTGTVGGVQSMPVQSAPGLTFQSVAAGDSFTCGVGTDGLGYCWGNNSAGQLGAGLPINTAHGTPQLLVDPA